MRIKLLFFILLTAALAGCCRSSDSGELSSCEFFPALGDAPLSNQFEVRVNGQAIVVEKVEKFDIPIHYSCFTFDGTTDLKIEVIADQPVKSYTISPKSKAIAGKTDGNKLSFTINKPQYIVVKINAMEDLFLMIDTPQDFRAGLDPQKIRSIASYGVDTTGYIVETAKIQWAIDEMSAVGGTLYFPNGIYKTGQINFRSNLTILLDNGVLIKGTTDPRDYPDMSFIRMDGVSNFKLLGYGTIDGSGWAGLRRNGARDFHLVFASDCSDILIDGPVLRDPVFWNTRVYRSQAFHMKNIKILNNRPYKNWTNTDGVDFDSSTDCSLVNALLHCGDDNLVVKGLDSERKFTTERILFDNIIALSNSAAAKIGTETCVERFADITFRNVDIVKCKRAMVINGFDSARIERVTFENINIESFDFNGSEGPRVVDFEITDHSWRECTGRCVIDDVLISNINIYCSDSRVESHIYGNNALYFIKNVTINGFNVNGLPRKSLEDSRILKNEFAENILIR